MGLAVSGGPDSLALLLLAAAARPGRIEAATVDHGLRPESVEEADLVAAVCKRLGVPHATLRTRVSAGSSLQARARQARYEALVQWMIHRGLQFLATAHHADDQAETLLMRLARGSGIGGLSAVREKVTLFPDLWLVRPLTGWRKAELVGLVANAGLNAAEDPSNEDERYDRTRFRALLASAPWIDSLRLARSAQALEEAEEALSFIAERLAAERIALDDQGVTVACEDLPAELQRRLLMIALVRLGRDRPKGPDTDRALNQLRSGGSCTIAGAKLTGGDVWRLEPEPPRRS